MLPPTTFVPGQVEYPEEVVSRTIVRALREEPGDVLVFLPGAREIRRVQSLLQSSGLDSSVRLFPLYGELSGDDQDAALQPSPPGLRKVVLATNIAETSLTIQGVRIIIDSGLVRRSLVTDTSLETDQAIMDGAIAMAWTAIDLAADPGLRARLLKDPQ